MNTNLNPLKDQFVLTDINIINKLVAAAKLKRSDTVLEIGSGTGNITAEIAKYGVKVIAFETDKKFRRYRSTLPPNVHVYYEKAKVPSDFKGKIISNPPFSSVEGIIHSLIYVNYEKVILLTSKKTLKTIANSGIYSSFFKAEILFEVPPTCFYPIPKTNSVVIDLLRTDRKKLDIFLRQFVYSHPNQLVKNSLMEGLVRFHKVTKNDARKIISEKNIEKEILENQPIGNDVYFLISVVFAHSK
ncbi:hypothetical protein BH10PAT1_BH10PAT1_7080 [soil metagenome]